MLKLICEREKYMSITLNENINVVDSAREKYFKGLGNISTLYLLIDARGMILKPEETN